MKHLALCRRARLRPKVPARQPRAIPDPQWEELFAAMRCIRDRALLACYVSSDARASELLGVQLGDVEWAKGQLWVISKGTRLRQAVPVSPEALAYLAGYLEEAGLAAGGGGPVWRTRRGEPRPLSYWATRRILQRAGEQLGTNWTLHDLRHTAATRMARDPALTLVEMQTNLAARASEYHRPLHGRAPGRPARSARRALPAARRAGPVVSDVRRRGHRGGLR